MRLKVPSGHIDKDVYEAYGFFECDVDRKWEKLPDGLEGLVDRTRYADMNDILLWKGFTMFLLIHAKCFQYALYFNKVNPEWKVMALCKDKMLNCGVPYTRMIHTFCSATTDNGLVLYSDARGITNDPEYFFAEYADDIDETAYIDTDYVSTYKNEDPEMFELTFEETFKIDLIPYSRAYEYHYKWYPPYLFL